MMEDIKEVDLSHIDDSYAVSNPVLAKMHNEADEIQKFIEDKIDLECISLLPSRLAQLDAYTHRVSDMQTRAKSMKEYAKMSYVANNEEALSKMTATNSNRIINAALYEFTITADRLESIYSSLTLACRNLSIQMSWIKKTMELGSC